MGWLGGGGGAKLELVRRKYLNFEPPFNFRRSRNSREALMNWCRERKSRKFSTREKKCRKPPPFEGPHGFPLWAFSYSLVEHLIPPSSYLVCTSAWLPGRSSPHTWETLNYPVHIFIDLFVGLRLNHRVVVQPKCLLCSATFLPVIIPKHYIPRRVSTCL